ncbi:MULTISPECIES: phage terminase small subunit [unclassified Pseudodesulfovibrio]|uniref:phage terminase small subunit n=1 Tax=unclassified Pseudodesulfovibrio TaxID=2661612 RepID=UPI000FEB6729|nr:MULTISPECIES: phage terminase small subunit [unclassified Pseudodesulfovibrio]MCJ2164649.1 phage terminase small subunit [Pseudodesulfovibrio sp. S3-i]RWU04159.1 hypothetical protein DWB63_09130 [Pseudodesulfovibrio sp. S3]
MSLMKRHQQKHQKGTAPSVVGTPDGAKASMGQDQLSNLLDSALGEDLKALSGIKSREAKDQHKREALIPKYLEYVHRLMDKGWAHDLLPYYMVWSFDVASVELALEIGFYCIDSGIGMPSDMYKSDVKTVMARSVETWAGNQMDNGHSVEPYFSTLFDAMTGANGKDAWDITDKLSRKLYKRKGLLEDEAGNLEAAQEYLQKAYDLGESVKTKLAEVTKQLEAAKAEEATAAEDSDK